MAKKEIKKVEIPLHIGDTAEFTKTVTETDVYLFGGITADYSQMHFNEEFMKKTMYGTRIVHGILTFAIRCRARPTDMTDFVSSARYSSGIR